MEHRLHLIWISRGLGRASKWTQNAARTADSGFRYASGSCLLRLDVVLDCLERDSLLVFVIRYESDLARSSGHSLPVDIAPHALSALFHSILFG